MLLTQNRVGHVISRRITGSEKELDFTRSDSYRWLILFENRLPARVTERSSPLGRAGFNPNSAVAIDKKREAQSFRSEVDGFLPLSRHQSAVLRGNVEPHSNDVRKRKMTLKLHSRTPSLLQDSTSLPATAESGLINELSAEISLVSD